MDIPTQHSCTTHQLGIGRPQRSLSPLKHTLSPSLLQASSCDS